MAQIKLSNLRHSYQPDPKSDADYALKKIGLTWEDGGAYALLGPSGCGKSTLLNIISGLLVPSEGKILFNDQDVTALPPAKRNIAQVFQFPVIYDTMSVYDNLAFPLRNRGRDEDIVKRRVTAIAEMLEVTDMLSTRAANLSPDNKQKISMGRGLVREDVNVVMFDEPLTVIDPHLKWKLRSKLKELHQRVKATMIYVTHDQTEAMTLADKIVLLRDGRVEQVGSPMELYNNPANQFVAGFLGAPSMNFLSASTLINGDTRTLGIRPEDLVLDPEGPLSGRVSHIENLGGDTNLIVDTDASELTVRLFGQHRIDVGEQIRISAQQDKQYFFDQNGQRIT